MLRVTEKRDFGGVTEKRERYRKRPKCETEKRGGVGPVTEKRDVALPKSVTWPVTEKRDAALPKSVTWRRALTVRALAFQNEDLLKTYRRPPEAVFVWFTSPGRRPDVTVTLHV